MDGQSFKKCTLKMFQNPGKKNEFYFWYCIGNSLRRKKKKCWKIIYIYDHSLLEVPGSFFSLHPKTVICRLLIL